MSDVETSRRTSWTAAELLAAELPEPRCAVDGLIPEGLAFMCGAPKLGKCWLGLGLAIAVAAGGLALGKIEVEQGEVLYLALEDNAAPAAVPAADAARPGAAARTGSTSRPSGSGSTTAGSNVSPPGSTSTPTRGWS